jgi:hypothetical protein
MGERSIDADVEPPASAGDDTNDGPAVRLTRIGIGAALALGRAAVAALAPAGEPPDRVDALSGVFGGPAKTDVPMLLAAVAFATAMRVDRLTSPAARTARRAARTAVCIADLSPLHPYLTRWRTDATHRSERARLDAEGARVRVTDRCGELMDALIAEVVRHVDVDEVISRVDVDAIVSRVDLNRVVDRLDLNRVVDRLDLNRVVDQVDVDRAVHRVDLAALTEEILDQVEVESIIRESTESMTDETVALLRQRAAGADRRLALTIDRVFRRHEPRELDLEPERET